MKKLQSVSIKPLKSIFFSILIVLVFTHQGKSQSYFRLVTNNAPSQLLYETATTSIGLGTTNPTAKFEIFKNTGVASAPNPIFKVRSLNNGYFEGSLSLMGNADILGNDELHNYGLWQQGSSFLNVFEGTLHVKSGANFIGQTTLSEGLTLDASISELPLPSNRYIRSKGPLEFWVLPESTPGNGYEQVMMLESEAGRSVRVLGRLTTESFQMRTNASASKVLVCDENGIGTWSDYQDSDWLFTASDGFEPPPPSGMASLYLNPDYNSVLIGTSTPVDGYKLAVNGNILCEELEVKLYDEWPDYVFSTSHTLRSLDEVDRFIAQHGHLPEVPSAQEVEQQGLKVGEMNTILLKKVEELTLYVIALKKEIDQLKAEVPAR